MTRAFQSWPGESNSTGGERDRQGEYARTPETCSLCGNSIKERSLAEHIRKNCESAGGRA